MARPRRIRKTRIEKLVTTSVEMVSVANSSRPVFTESIEILWRRRRSEAKKEKRKKKKEKDLREGNLKEKS